jgi:hypothetical protein
MLASYALCHQKVIAKSKKKKLWELKYDPLPPYISLFLSA